MKRNLWEASVVNPLALVMGVVGLLAKLSLSPTGFEVSISCSFIALIMAFAGAFDPRNRAMGGMGAALGLLGLVFMEVPD